MLIQNLPRCGPPPSGQHRMRRVVGHHRWICPAGATPLNSACEVASAWGALPLATWQFKATGAPDVGTSVHWPWQATPTPPLVVQRVVRQREGSRIIPCWIGRRSSGTAEIRWVCPAAK